MEKSDENSTENTILPILTFEQTSKTQDKQESQQIECLKCEQIFQFPKGKEDYLAHIFLIHRLVIADEGEIGLLEEYLKYWNKEFKQHDLEEYCTTMLLDHLPDGTPAKNERYYLLSDILPKDYELRTRLKKERLEKALAQHQFELSDRNFSRECLYCRDVITGLRSLYLEHLFNKHFLQLGKPENLIYIDELIDKVHDNLENLICLYCEKVFKDRVTLKEHMRKKAHKRINPSNKIYDKYFLQNYKFPEKAQYAKNQPKRNNKQQINKTATMATTSTMAATTTRTRSSSQRTADSVDFEQRFAHNSDSDSDWSDWNGEAVQPLICLYCRKQSKDFQEFKQHLQQQHLFDFDESLKDLNFYQKIKVVNYIRKQVYILRCVTCDQRFENQELLLKHLEEEKHFGIGTQKQWDNYENLFSTYDDDGLLYLLDDNSNNDIDDTVVPIFSEDPVAQINKDAERLSLDNFNFL